MKRSFIAVLARLDQRSQQHGVSHFVDVLLDLEADLLMGYCLENEVLVVGSRVGIRASRTYLALAVKRSSLAAYFGLRPGDRLEKVAGRNASELDPRALRSALAAERVELAFARRSLEDAEEVASIRIQATWRGHRQRGGSVGVAANPFGEVSATNGSSRKKLKEDKATPSMLIPGSRMQASWPSDLQQLRFYEFPPHHHLLSRVFMIYKVMSPQPLCFGDLLLSVDAREASDLDASTLSHLLGSGESLQLTFARGSPEDREEIAATRIQSAFRARRGRKDRNWVRWLLEGLRPLYVLPGLAHLQERLQGKPMAPRLVRRQLQKPPGEAFLATPTGGDGSEWGLRLHVTDPGGPCRALAVKLGSWADESGVRPGDHLVSVDDQPVLELLTEIPTRLVKVGVGSLRLRDAASAAGALSFENAEEADRELASALRIQALQRGRQVRKLLADPSPGVALRFILGRRDAELRAAESALAQVEARTPDLASIVRSLRQKVAARDFRIANLEANAEAAAFVGRGLAEKLQKLETLQKDVSLAETDHTLSLVASLRRLEGLPLRYGAANGAELTARKVPLTRHAACTADDEAPREEIERMRMQLEEAHEKLRLREQTKDEPEEHSMPSPGPKGDSTQGAVLEEVVSGEQEVVLQGAVEEGSREELECKAPVSAGAQVSQSTQTEDPAPESVEEGKAARASEPEAATECPELALLDGTAAAASEPSRRENTETGVEKEERQEGKEGKQEEEEREEGEEGKEGKEGKKEDESLGEETLRGLLGSPEPGPSASGTALALALPMPEQHDVENSWLLHQEAMDGREALLPVADTDASEDAASEELDVSDERLQQWLRAVADTMASMREESASEAASSHEEGSRMLFLTVEAAYGHLGFRLTAPPGHFVYRCEEGSWADQVGLQQGDQLVQLQGMDVGLLPHALLLLALERHRPLELTFARGFGVGSLVEDIAGSLSGLRARSQAPADTQEATAATSSRAEENLEDHAHPPSVEDDRVMALAAVQKNCDAYPLLSLPMRYDREITLEAVRQKGGLLQYTSPVLQTDREVVGAAVQQSGAALRFAAPARRNEVGLVRRAVTTTPEIFPFLPAEQKARRELASVAVARDGMLLSAVPALQDDKDIVLAAVKQNPAALQFASSSLRYDKDILRLCLGTPDG
ncbi:unnamed protein product [Symbiodinium sp. CCMP2592]|nr:unnamed protein product [Symbiodinium sp. CCMP2592]